MAKIPTPELVAESFLRTITDDTWGCTTTLPVLEVLDGKNLPRDNWNGKRLWVTPRGYGTAVPYPVPVRKTFIVVSVWCKPYDKRRAWGDALALAQDLIEAGMDWYSNTALEIPYPNYRSVELTSFRPISDVRRIENDPQGLAHVQFDVELNYNLKE